MPRDIEAELRRSLQARAADITPDPALYSRVQARIRRARTFRFAFAGLATAMVIAGVAVAAPQLMDRRIEFEPGPVATQPAPEASEVPDVGAERPPFVFLDEAGVHLDGPLGETVLPPSADGVLTSVTVRPGSTPREGTVVAADSIGDCGQLIFDGWTAEAEASDADAKSVDVAGGCPSSPTFSPDGTSLAWASRTADGWSIATVDWTEDGPGDDDASFGLPWPADQPVDIQDWVWTELTSTTAKGYLVVRTQRDGGWVLLQVPIERQADGALAVALETRPLTAMTSGFTPVAFSHGGGDYSTQEDLSYVMELDMGAEGITAGRIVHRFGAEGAGVVDLPPEVFNNTNPPFDVADLWMSAAGDQLVYGNAGQQRAWSVDWSHIKVSTSLVEIADGNGVRAIVHADLLGPAQLPTEAPEPATLTSVEVYFGMTGADACVADQPVTREVESPGVARGALNELLKGPSSQESNEGVVSPFNAVTAGALNDIKIVDGQARVDFNDFSSKLDDDSCTKSAILDALNKTLFQFETITSTQYSFDGDVEAFEEWLGRGPESPPLMPDPVAQTADEILAAAQTHDWDALRRLSAETSCTLSDQKEPCVPHWKEQEANGEDPLGILVELLEGPAAKIPDAPMWVWPEEWAAGEGYNGPRIGIDEDGVWRYYVQEGG